MALRSHGNFLEKSSCSDIGPAWGIERREGESSQDDGSGAKRKRTEGGARQMGQEKESAQNA